MVTKLKLGKENRIYVDGKTLNQISEESGVRLATVQHRYSRGVRDYRGLTKPSHISVEQERVRRKKVYCNISAGEKVLEKIWERDINLSEMSRATGVSRTAIYNFLYDGMDISSMRLAKICSYLDVSMDYVMGIEREERSTRS